MSYDFVFGYGSLVHQKQASLYCQEYPEKNAVQYCYLTGYRRTWNVAMNNGIDLPGYKYYLEAHSGKRPACFVTFLNIEEMEDAKIFGVLFKVAPEKLIEIDKRERNYKRRNITENLDIPVNGTAWVYIGLEEAEKRFQYGFKQQCAVISKEYFDLVLEAYASLGPDQIADYLATTAVPPVPKVNIIVKML